LLVVWWWFGELAVWAGSSYVSCLTYPQPTHNICSIQSQTYRHFYTQAVVLFAAESSNSSRAALPKAMEKISFFRTKFFVKTTTCR
jgi:hypothetical protein